MYFDTPLNPPLDWVEIRDKVMVIINQFVTKRGILIIAQFPTNQRIHLTRNIDLLRTFKYAHLASLFLSILDLV